MLHSVLLSAGEMQVVKGATGLLAHQDEVERVGGLVGGRAQKQVKMVTPV